MSTEIYTGINGTARKITKAYVGVNGVAREITSAYIGVNNIARQVYSSGPVLKSFSEATDAEITAMLNALDEGIISYDALVNAGWNVGATRTVHLSAMDATGVGESHVEQDRIFTILHGKDMFDLSDGAQVPILTESNSDIIGSTDAWKVFDGDDSTSIELSGSDNVGYHFSTPVVIKRVKVLVSGRNVSIRVYAKNDGDSNWTILVRSQTVSPGTAQDIIIDNDTAYQNYVISDASSGFVLEYYVKTLQFYTTIKEDPGKNHFVIGLKNTLANKFTGEYGYINSTNTNVGGWKESARRAWCDNVFRLALPTEVQKWFKKFKYKVSAGNKSTTIETLENYFTLPAEYEISGSTSYSVAGENTIQMDYYKTSDNRVKRQGDGGSTTAWWGRSPYGKNATAFCLVTGSGGAYNINASADCGLSPYGVV